MRSARLTKRPAFRGSNRVIVDHSGPHGVHSAYENLFPAGCHGNVLVAKVKALPNSCANTGDGPFAERKKETPVEMIGTYRTLSELELGGQCGSAAYDQARRHGVKRPTARRGVVRW